MSRLKDPLLIIVIYQKIFGLNNPLCISVSWNSTAFLTRKANAPPLLSIFSSLLLSILLGELHTNNFEKFSFTAFDVWFHLTLSTPYTVCACVFLVWYYWWRFLELQGRRDNGGATVRRDTPPAATITLSNIPPPSQSLPYFSLLLPFYFPHPHLNFPHLALYLNSLSTFRSFQRLPSLPTYLKPDACMAWLHLLYSPLPPSPNAFLLLQ